ncbi:MAG: HYR domain-containing protein [Acidobacteria bacterium]|nr:HYR domain-containing protein [Acidobacteriota bacterium]
MTRTSEIASVFVVLDGLTHTFPDDLDILLVGPQGHSVLLMSDAGGGRDLDNLAVEFTSEADGSLPDDERIEPGAYLATNHTELFGDEFPPPAPTPGYGESLDVFEGSDPNGTWRLFVVDNARGDRGELAAGWTLRLVLANRAPVASCQAVVVGADGGCTADASIDSGSTDPDGDEIVLSQSPAGPYPIGTTTVTLTVTDQYGLSDQCSGSVTVVDISPPELSCPSSQSASVSASCLAAIPNVLTEVSATDDCTASGGLTVSQSPVAGTMIGPGVHTISVSATDAAGNVGTCSTTFTVTDAQPPTIAGPVPAIYLRTSNSAGGAPVTFPLPSASDNCSSVSVTAVPASGTTFPNGKTLVTATATDAAGLTASTQFTVKVVRFGESIGIYIPSTAGWFLRNTNSDGVADLTFSFGPGGTGWVPIAGDWDRSGTDTPGLFYNPTAGVFLSDTNGPGGADYVFSYGPSGSSWIPITGDWNGEGVDSVGLYDPSTGNFFLKNINAAGYADVILQLGPGNAGFLPIVGDWNGDGIDTVGIYSPETGVFFLRNSNTNGPADLTFTYGAGGKGYLPISGDWNGDNICTIGLYDPSTGTFLLRNSNDEGAADVELTFGPSDQGAVPVAGSWDGQ